MGIGYIVLIAWILSGLWGYIHYSYYRINKKNGYSVQFGLLMACLFGPLIMLFSWYIKTNAKRMVNKIKARFTQIPNISNEQKYSILIDEARNSKKTFTGIIMKQALEKVVAEKSGANGKS